MSSGHITHFWIAISDDIRTKMQKCEWRKRLDTIVDEVTTMIKDVELKVKSVAILRRIFLKTRFHCRSLSRDRRGEKSQE
jgi:hypothetical protein